MRWCTKELMGTINYLCKQEALYHKYNPKCVYVFITEIFRIVYSHNKTYLSNILRHMKIQSLTIHYIDVIMGVMASQITSLTVVYSTVYSGADERKHQSSAPLAFVRGIHRGPINSPHNGPVTRKIFPFDDVIMYEFFAKWFGWSDIRCHMERINNSHWRLHDDVIIWKHFPRYWPFVRGIPRSPVNSPHKGQRHGALMFSWICAWTNGWVNNYEVFAKWFGSTTLVKWHKM